VSLHVLSTAHDTYLRQQKFNNIKRRAAVCAEKLADIYWKLIMFLSLLFKEMNLN
jgi:hypothetical protein